MGLYTLIQGAIIGLIVSAPIGPVGILCIQRTLNRGKWAGYFSGLGASVGDLVYAVFAGFGISMITNFLVDQQNYLRLFGGMILIAMGTKMFFTNTVKQARKQRERSSKGNLLGDFISIFVLNATNPVTIIAFGVLFASANFDIHEDGFIVILSLILGVFLGAAIWWFALVTLVNLFRSKFKLRRLHWINKLSGVGVAIFGVAAILSIFLQKEAAKENLTSDFSSTYTSVYAGTTVEFMCESFDENLNYHWTFEGGIPLEYEGANPPAVRYDSIGVFDVTLLIEDSEDSVIVKKQNYISVHPESILGTKFIASPRYIKNPPYNVEFRNETPDGESYSFIWDFGDSTTSTGYHPRHQYKDTGHYTIRLIATNPQTGITDSTVQIDYIFCGITSESVDSSGAGEVTQ